MGKATKSSIVTGVVVGVIVVAVLITVVTLAVTLSRNNNSDTVVRSDTKPNIILFLADDTGYADFQAFGHPTQEWGAVERMAEEGMKFTQWTSSERLCTPSRTAMLTGRYAVRSGSYGYNRHTYLPDAIGGLARSEITIPEALKDLGYTTGMVGKWHLGINKENSTDGYHLPKHHGFDYVGRNLPFSQWRVCLPSTALETQQRFCFLYDNTTIIEQPINLNTLTDRLVVDGKKFINDNKEEPFFLYFSFPQTHDAMFCDERFCGKSIRGPYGDNVNEMAWAIGEILDEVEKLGIEKDTLAIFLSDHGPQRYYGSAGMFRGGKGTSWEGGFRVPAVAWWPGTISANTVSHTFVNTLDLFPTFLQLAGSPDYLKDRNITTDGGVMYDITMQTGPQTPRESFFYYCADRIMAVRYGKYKVHYKTFGFETLTALPCYGDHILVWDPPLIYNLESDPQENEQLDTDSEEMQEMLETVKGLVESHNATVPRLPPDFDPINPSLVPCCDPPRCTCNYNNSTE